MLSRSAWIYYSAGELHAPPFVTRCLLYRLYDIDCSILIYHEQSANEPAFVTRKGAAAVTWMKTTCQAAEKICIHYTHSSSIVLEELASLPRMYLNLFDASSRQLTFDKARIVAEPIYLPCSEMSIAFENRNEQFEHQISGTAYWVRGLVSVENLGLVSPEAKCRCWKLSVENLSTMKYYDLTESCEWGLAALDVDNDWAVASEIRLEKKMNSGSRLLNLGRQL